jgi:hypothetical protein
MGNACHRPGVDEQGGKANNVRRSSHAEPLSGGRKDYLARVSAKTAQGAGKGCGTLTLLSVSAAASAVRR